MHIVQALIVTAVLLVVRLVHPVTNIALLPLCACWVAWDAQDVPPPPARSFLARPSLVLFFGVLLFWPFVFPWYLAKHLKHRAATQRPGPPTSSSSGFAQQTPAAALVSTMAPAPEDVRRAARQRQEAIQSGVEVLIALLKVAMVLGLVGYAAIVVIAAGCS
jgi:hypothetical protein